MIPAHLLNETATNSREQTVSDGQGGWTTEHASVGTFRCRVRPLTTEEQLIARQQQVRLSWIVYAEPDADVRRGDLIEVRGLELDVMSVREPSVSGHHLVVDCDTHQA